MNSYVTILYTILNRLFIVVTLLSRSVSYYVGQLSLLTLIDALNMSVNQNFFSRVCENPICQYSDIQMVSMERKILFFFRNSTKVNVQFAQKKTSTSTCRELQNVKDTCKIFISEKKNYEKLY